MRKRKTARTVACGLALGMMMSMLTPANAFAADNQQNTTPYDTEKVKFYYAQNSGGDYYRTGVQQIVLEPYTYVDISGGKHMSLKYDKLKGII